MACPLNQWGTNWRIPEIEHRLYQLLYPDVHKRAMKTILHVDIWFFGLYKKSVICKNRSKKKKEEEGKSPTIIYSLKFGQPSNGVRNLADNLTWPDLCQRSGMITKTLCNRKGLRRVNWLLLCNLRTSGKFFNGID